MKTNRTAAGLTYPRAWEFTIIGFDAGRLREVVARAVGDQAHTVADSRQSRTGKYVSVTLTLTVRDEAHRNGIVTALRDSKDVIGVI